MSGSDPLASLISAISFTTITEDVVGIGALGVVLYLAWVGIKWVLRMVKVV